MVLSKQRAWKTLHYSSHNRISPAKLSTFILPLFLHITSAPVAPFTFLLDSPLVCWSIASALHLSVQLVDCIIIILCIDRSVYVLCVEKCPTKFQFICRLQLTVNQSQISSVCLTDPNICCSAVGCSMTR